MNLKLLFRIFFGLNAVFVLGAVVSPEAMLESFGMNYNADVGLMIQFAMMVQIMFLALTYQLPDWLGDNLAKAGMTYVVLCLIPLGLNSYHVITDTLPAGPAFFVENTMWIAFAVLFYLYSKK